ncbi:hypothetical protein PO124_29800 [Bacillus licheniformis]|nr:hypothetical protein [Bacillus licheniformis]
MANLFMAGTSSTEITMKRHHETPSDGLTDTKKQIEDKAGNSAMANNQFTIGKT